MVYESKTAMQVARVKALFLPFTGDKTK